jgi:pyruvate/2-oxoglutarate dehydrogenase complex dihydrolipoamide dehydrogenase (E3) component
LLFHDGNFPHRSRDTSPSDLESCVGEQSEQIAAHEDADVAVELQKLLEEEGIVFHLSTEVVSTWPSAEGVRVSLKSNEGMEEFAASHVFVATGRLPNTDDLGLDSVGVKVSKRGIVEVDRRLATNIPGIWAAGDIRGGPMFTHTSWDDYRILLSQMAGDGTRTTERVIPYGVFTDPELGRVGMTENEARKAGNKVKTARFDINRNGKAKEIGETAGFIKVVIDEETNLLLGAAVLANEGAELVHMYIDLMNAKAPYTVIRDAVHIHPTLAEAVQSAVSELDKV